MRTSPSQEVRINVRTQAVTARIRQLNDRFRMTFIGGTVVLTEGVDALGDVQKMVVLKKVQMFDAFTEDNDPHHEHDFGAFESFGERYFWKLDYYAPDMQGGSEDPADPEKTRRVMTIIRAEEY